MEIFCSLININLYRNLNILLILIMIHVMFIINCNIYDCYLVYYYSAYHYDDYLICEDNLFS